MARPMRVQFPGGIYHVTARGNEQKPIFEDDADCCAFLRVLESVVRRYHLLCHAYCLMGNHYHLLLETPEANLSRAMRQLNGLYSQGFNRRYERSGHLLGGRFHAVVVRHDAHLREISRYIVLNPVRAGLVSHPAEWRWSSYSAMVGHAPAPRFLSTDWLLALSGIRERAGAQAAYRAFVMAGLDEEAELFLARPAQPAASDGKSALGARVAWPSGSGWREFPRAERFAGRPRLSEVFSDVASRAERNARCALAVQSFGYTLREIADFLGLHYATVSRVLPRGDDLGQKMS